MHLDKKYNFLVDKDKFKMDINLFFPLIFTTEAVPEPSSPMVENELSQSMNKSGGKFDESALDTITCATFADSFPNKVKPDTKTTTLPTPVPTLWIGTQTGALFIASISMPSNEERSKEPVIVSISQTLYQLSGQILAIDILPMSQFVSAKPHHLNDSFRASDQVPKLKTKQSAPSGGLPVFPGNTLPDSNVMQAQNSASQLAVVVARDQLVTLILPAQTVASRARPVCSPDGDSRRQLCKASVIKPRENQSTHCVACLSTDGQVSFFSLPRLRPLFDIDQCLDPLSPRSLNTFRFSDYCFAVYFHSPSELCKLSFWTDTK